MFFIDVLLSEYHIEVPCNTTCTIFLYQAENVIDPCGLEFVCEDGQYKAECMSGSYDIVYQMNQDY